MSQAPATPADATRGVSLSRMRRAVVRTVTASAAVPQFSVEYDVDTAPLVTARDHWRSSGSGTVSVTDLLNAAVARTLPDHPLLTASFSEQGTVVPGDVHVAFIVEVDDGMMTPVLRHADRLSIPDLSVERGRLTAAARGGGLRPEELLSGTFTVSNLGPLGIPRFTAMVLPPQSAVLAVGSATPAGTLTLTLSCDHRVIDGAPAARFLADVGRCLADVRRLTSDELGRTA